MAIDSIIQRRLYYAEGGRFASECPAGLDRNRWPVWIGIGGRFGSEWVAGLDRNTHSLLSQYRRLEEDIENVQGRVKEINDKIGKVLKREITDKDDSLVLLNNELGKIESELSKTKEAVEAKQETLNKISNSLDQMSLVTDILSLEGKKRVVEQITESEEYQQMEKLRDQMATLVNDLDKIKKTTSEASYARAQEKISTAERVIDKYFRQITNNSSVRGLRHKSGV